MHWNAWICPNSGEPGWSARTRFVYGVDGTSAGQAAQFYAGTFPGSAVRSRPPRAWRLSRGQAGRYLDRGVHGDGHPLSRPERSARRSSTTRHSHSRLPPMISPETDRLWNAIVGNGGQESACGWCKDKWGLSWQITPRALTDAIADPDRAAAKRAFEAMMGMGKIDIAAIRNGSTRLSSCWADQPASSRSGVRSHCEQKGSF